MINEFLKTYKDGGMVYLDPTERDRIVEEINRLKKIDESHQRLNGELREENDRLNNIINKAINYIETERLVKGTEWYRIELLDILKGVIKSDRKRFKQSIKLYETICRK